MAAQELPLQRVGRTKLSESNWFMASCNVVTPLNGFAREVISLIALSFLKSSNPHIVLAITFIAYVA
jgi:hypothetical protein